MKKHQAQGVTAKEIRERAERVVGWKGLQGKRRTIPKTLLSGGDEEKDVLAQRLLFLTVSLHFTPYSNEVRLVRESIQALVKARLTTLLGETDENRIIGLLSDLLKIKIGAPTVDGGMRFNGLFVNKKELYTGSQVRYGDPWKIKYAVDWRELIGIIRAKKLRFVDIYLIQGVALLSLHDLIEYYSELVALKVEEFIESRFEEFQSMKKGELKVLLDQTAELSEYLSEVSGRSYRSTMLKGRAGRLRPGNFPPCIEGIVSGVQSGSRNYAISMLLTSFLSYARIAPRKVQNPRVSDYVKDEKVLTDEILPMIYEAAALCKPPLFEDQPGEKLNINYHLGLGLTSQIKLENSGSSNWYFPPNCEKIRRESPGLCKPDETCKEIRNPLTYYFVKFKKEDDKSEEDAG